MHQPAGRVVDEHEQRALRPAILKPPMLATVDLHQFAGAFAPVARLMNALQALLAIEPQPSLDHPKAKGLAAENDPVQLAQLLGRQGRAEIPVALANERQCLGANLLGFASVTGATTALRYKTRRTLGPICPQKPEYLTPLKTQQLSRRRGRQPSLIQIPQHLKPPKLSIAHQLYRHPRHPPENPRGVSFLSGKGVTF